MNDHSASRHIDILRLEAPHLIGEAGTAAGRARDAGIALKTAIGNGRVELEANGELDESTWNLIDLLTDQLVNRLDELEQADRRAGRRHA